MRLDLNGGWECTFPDGRTIEVQVPGCWDTYVEEKNIAERVRFRRFFETEQTDEGRYRICFGAVSYYCEVYLNGQKLGSHEGMWDGFSMEAGNALKKGTNELVVDVWKPGYHSGDRFPLREVLSGFIPDVLCTFGGIWDNVWLESAPGYFVEGHRALGDPDGSVKIMIDLELPADPAPLSVTGGIYDREQFCAARVDTVLVPGETVCIRAEVNSPLLWEPEHPELYEYHLTLDDGLQRSVLTGRFGFREFRAEGTKLLLNQKPVYARGILHWGYYEEIVPTPADEKIRDEIEKVRGYGFNMIKHCLYIPRENYLRLADELGILLWVELPLWLPEKTPCLADRIRREFPKLMDQLAGHPSVVMLSLGCELDAKVDSEVLEEMYLLAKEKLNVPIRDNSGSGECYDGLSVDYADFSDYHFYGELQNMENLMETFTPVWKQNRPWLFGEFCDSDTLRDMEVLRREKQVDHFNWELQDEVKNPICILKPDFFLGEHDARMEASGIRAEYQKLAGLSYNHSMVHRKVTLEQMRAFPTIGGYNITSIRDVPIATSGIFDDFMRGKFDRETFRRFNQDVMLLPAWDLTRVWINADRVMSKERYGFFGGESYGLHILVSNYGGTRIERPLIRYKLCGSDGATVLEGQMDGAGIENGEVGQTCYLYFNLPEVRGPQTFVLNVKLEYGKSEVVNEWPVFLYPRPETAVERIGLYDPLHVFDTVEKLYSQTEKTDGRENLSRYRILFCSVMTPEILDYVRGGGSVVYVQRGRGDLDVNPVAFWREGMIRSYEHPILAGLEQSSWMDDMRWFGSATDTAFTDLQDTRFDYRKPILSRYDCREWRKDHYLMELGCGEGRIIATTLRLEGGMGKQPLFLENNRLGRWILQQAVTYLLGDC